MGSTASDSAAITAAVVMIVCASSAHALKIKIKFVDKFQLDKLLGLVLMVAAGSILSVVPATRDLFWWVFGLAEGIAGFFIGVALGMVPDLAVTPGLTGALAHGLMIAGASVFIVWVAVAAFPKGSDLRMSWRIVHLSVALPLLATICLSSLGDVADGPISWCRDTVGGWMIQQTKDRGVQ